MSTQNPDKPELSLDDSLEGRDHVFILDDSIPMNQHAAEVENTFETLTCIVKSRESTVRGNGSLAKHDTIPSYIKRLSTLSAFERKDTDKRRERAKIRRWMCIESRPDSNIQFHHKTNNHWLRRFLLLSIATTGSLAVFLSDILQRTNLNGLIDRRELLYLEKTIPPDIYKSLISHLSSPATLILGVAITTASLTTYRYLHRHEKHQPLILIAFLAAGIVVGKLAGLDNIAILLRVLPWCAILGLLASTACAFLASKRQGPLPRVEFVADEKA